MPKNNTSPKYAELKTKLGIRGLRSQGPNEIHGPNTGNDGSESAEILRFPLIAISYVMDWQNLSPIYGNSYLLPQFNALRGVVGRNRTYTLTEFAKALGQAANAYGIYYALASARQAKLTVCETAYVDNIFGLATVTEIEDAMDQLRPMLTDVYAIPHALGAQIERYAKNAIADGPYDYDGVLYYKRLDRTIIGGEDCDADLLTWNEIMSRIMSNTILTNSMLDIYRDIRNYCKTWEIPNNYNIGLLDFEEFRRLIVNTYSVASTTFDDGEDDGTAKYNCDSPAERFNLNGKRDQFYVYVKDGTNDIDILDLLAFDMEFSEGSVILRSCQVITRVDFVYDSDQVYWVNGSMDCDSAGSNEGNTPAIDEFKFAAILDHMHIFPSFKISQNPKLRIAIDPPGFDLATFTENQWMTEYHITRYSRLYELEFNGKQDYTNTVGKKDKNSNKKDKDIAETSKK